MGISLSQGKRYLATLLVAMAAWLGSGSFTWAEVLIFKNDSKVALVVQGACVINGKLKRDQPMLVQPGGTARVLLPGDKLINVYDARQPNVALFQGTIPGTNEDKAFSMVPDLVPGKLRMEPLKLPMGPNP